MLDQIFRNMSPMVRNLLIANVAVFIIMRLLAQTQNMGFMVYFIQFHYTSPNFMPLQYVTSMFSHYEIWHILFNMLALVSFGSQLERFIGEKKMLFLYLSCGIAGGLLTHIGSAIELMFMGESVFISIGETVNNPANLTRVSSIVNTSGLGASGALFGIFAVVYRYFPNTEVMLMFLPFRFKIKQVFIFFMAASIILAIYPFVLSGIGHLAHLGGAFCGLAISYFWQKDKKEFY